jgi:SpoVK/Ycf46/Vps4 family AAA+-type ATPase
LNGIDPPRVIGFIDEIEKAFAGFGTDSSGVKTDMTGTMLTWMQDRNVDGCLFLGPPGCAKSAVGKAAGNLAGKLTIAFDLSAMQNSEVGKSGERLRAALNVMDAISDGRVLFIATCNSIGSLPPELRRRFKSATFFFDLPTAEERDLIWKIYLNKYGVSGALPRDDGWTGAEIKECCEKSYRLKISLEQAASYIVPVSRSAAEQIKSLRLQSSGKYVSASLPGVYQYEESNNASLAGPSRRKIREEVSRAV